MKIISPLLNSQPRIRHAFFTREGGVSDGIYGSLNGGLGSNDDHAHVVRNRDLMAEAIGVNPDSFMTLFQIHSPDVVEIEKPWALAERPKADAMVTALPNVALGITTADCGPVLFADAQARVIGAAHAGWKGALTGVIEATLAAMFRHGAAIENIAVAIGPMISQAHYEVGPEFVARFVAEDAGNGKYFVPSSRAEHAMFDLPSYVRMRLTKAGVTQIEDLALCTYADEKQFFSYRRSVHRNEGDYGRHVHAIMLES